jgi:hypothetical protein
MDREFVRRAPQAYQLRERIAIENMKRVMNTDFAAESVE